MKSRIILRIAVLCMVAIIAASPMNAYASTVLKVGSKGSTVLMAQTTLQKLGYFTYPVMTGYYGSVTKTAVKRFQKDSGLVADGVIGKKTMALLLPAPSKISPAVIKLAYAALTPQYSGDLDWFTQVRDLWKRGVDATITDVDTGKTFQVKRTYGTNHADVETLTKEDTAIMKEIWGGFSWERRAVIVHVAGYTLAGSMTAMPHAGLENKREGAWVFGRSAGFGYGYNYDAIKGNGISGHMDIHFKNSRTHGTGVVQKIHQDMVRKAAMFIAKMILPGENGSNNNEGTPTDNGNTQGNNDNTQNNTSDSQNNDVNIEDGNGDSQDNNGDLQYSSGNIDQNVPSSTTEDF